MSLIITIMVLECEYCITWNSVQCKLNGIDSCFKGTLFLKLFLLSFYFLFKVLTRLSVVWDQRQCHNTKSCKVRLLSCNDIKCPSIVRMQKYMFITETDILISLSIYIPSEGTLCDRLIDCFCVKSEINRKKMQTPNSWKWNNLVWYLRTYFSNLAVWGLFCMTCAWKK